MKQPSRFALPATRREGQQKGFNQMFAALCITVGSALLLGVYRREVKR